MHLTQHQKYTLLHLFAICVARSKTWHYTAYDDFLARKIADFLRLQGSKNRLTLNSYQEPSNMSTPPLKY